MALTCRNATPDSKQRSSFPTIMTHHGLARPGDNATPLLGMTTDSAVVPDCTASAVGITWRVSLKRLADERSDPSHIAPRTAAVSGSGSGSSWRASSRTREHLVANLLCRRLFQSSVSVGRPPTGWSLDGRRGARLLTRPRSCIRKSAPTVSVTAISHAHRIASNRTDPPSECRHLAVGIDIAGIDAPDSVGFRSTFDQRRLHTRDPRVVSFRTVGGYSSARVSVDSFARRWGPPRKPPQGSWGTCAASVILGTRACVRSDRWLLPSLPRTKNEAAALSISVTILDVNCPTEAICVRDLRPPYIEWSRPSMMLRQRRNRTNDVYCTARTGNGTPARFVRRRTLTFSSTTSRHTIGTKVTFLFAGT